MKNIEELLEYLKLIENEILNAANDTLQMSVFTFFQTYDENNESFNYPSFRINLKTKDIKEYALTLLSRSNAILKKSSEIKDFNYSNNKSTIDFINLNINNENTLKIKNCIQEIKNSNTESLANSIKSSNCLFIEIKVNNNNYSLFAKGCPFVRTKQFVFQIDEDNNVTSVKYNLKFPLSLSACIFNNEVYLFGSLVESIFGFENSLKAQMYDAMKEVEESSIFDTDSLINLSSFAAKGRNYYCYSNYDSNKLNALKSNNKYAKDFLLKYSINKNSQGKLVLDTPEKQKIINKFLCNDLKRDYININQVYDAPGNDIID